MRAAAIGLWTRAVRAAKAKKRVAFGRIWQLSEGKCEFVLEFFNMRLSKLSESAKSGFRVCSGLPCRKSWRRENLFKHVLVYPP